MAAQLQTNYHMHSKYCDGQGEIADYVQAALADGFTSIGHSSHAPIPYPNNYAMREEALAAYIADVQRTKADYAGQIEIALGSEIDIIPGIQDYFNAHLVPQGFDYFIGSVHFLGDDPATGEPWEFDAGADHFGRGWRDFFGEDFRRMAEQFYALERQVPNFIPGVTIVGHMDRIKRFNYGDCYFHEDVSWYRDAVEETLQVFAQADIIVELNTAGWRTPTGAAFPSDWICQRCHALGIRMTINTDAHRPEQMTADHTRGIAQLHDAGYREIWVRHGGQWVAEALPTS